MGIDWHSNSSTNGFLSLAFCTENKFGVQKKEKEIVRVLQ